MKVRAIKPGYDGFALVRRKVGDVFDIPIDEKKFESKWLERVEEEEQPTPKHKSAVHKTYKPAVRAVRPAHDSSTGSAEVI